MFTLTFYKCARCGNIAVKALDRGPALSCCDEQMAELVPGSTDGAREKHVPVIERAGERVTVSVGSAVHPMEADHYIELICLHTTAGVQAKYLKPGDQPVAVFLVPEDAKVVEAFEHCNKHGLWKSEG